MRAFVGLFLLAAAACAAPTEDSAASSAASIAPSVAELRYEPRFVLEKVLGQKGLTFDAKKPFPAIRFASEVTLAEFQDAIEPQWGFRPDVITNAYAVGTNVIYLIDEAPYYAVHGRCIDDSLAHELTHYAQVVYQGWHLDGADDFIEMDAVSIQRWFREGFCGG